MTIQYRYAGFIEIGYVFGEFQQVLGERRQKHCSISVNLSTGIREEVELNKSHMKPTKAKIKNKNKTKQKQKQKQKQNKKQQQQ